MREQGMAEAVGRLAADGVSVVGICGGYQMLGDVILDPDHTESPLDSAPGLGLLPVQTTFAGEKATHQAEGRVLGGPGWLSGIEGETVRGYEIHMGRTSGSREWLKIDSRSGNAVGVRDGAVDDEGKVWGCYLHGIFENRLLRRAWLKSLGWQEPVDGAGGTQMRDDLESALDRLADVVEAALDMEQLEALVSGPA
jgi:adenosylcobyric acid synthase